jgi:glycosyltransferase involved in cell wall biosynthesis
MEGDDILVVNFCVFEEGEDEYFTKNQIKEYSASLSEEFNKVWLVGNVVPRGGNLTSKIESDSVEVVPYIHFEANFLTSVLVGMTRVIRASFASSKAIVNVPSMGYALLMIPIALLTDHLSVYVAMNPHDAVDRSQTHLRGRVTQKIKHWINLNHTKLALRLSDSVLVRGDKSRYGSYGNVHESRPIISIRDTVDEVRTEGEFSFLYVGGLYERKGLAVLINSFAQVANEFEDIRLRIVGDGEQRESLEQLARSLNVENQVKFEGYIDDSTKLANMYYQSDVLVHPAKRGEGFPRVIDEAHIYNLPVITTDLNHFSNSLTDGENVLLASPDSISSLAKELRKIIQDSELRKKVAKNGQKRVEGLRQETAADQHAAIIKGEYRS